MAEQKTTEPSRWRTGRVSFRLHEDLKRGLEFLAAGERRTLSQYIELLLIDHVQATLRNGFDADGQLLGSPRQPLELRDPRRR